MTTRIFLRNEIRRQADSDAETRAAKSEIRRKIKDLVDKHLDYSESLTFDGAGPIPQNDFILDIDGHPRSYLVQCELWNDRKQVEVYVFPQKSLVSGTLITKEKLDANDTAKVQDKNLLRKFIRQALFESGLCIAKGYWSSDGQITLSGLKDTKILDKLKIELQTRGSGN